MVTRSGSDAELVSLFRLQWNAAATVEHFSVFGEGAPPGARAIALPGDVDADGHAELIVGQDGEIGGARRNWIRVYEMPDGRSPELAAEVSAYQSPWASSSANFLVGDVDPNEAGQEIIVGDDGSTRRAAQIRVFGGMATGALRELWKFRALPARAASRAALAFAVGDVIEPRTRQEIVVGDEHGWLWLYALKVDRIVRFGRFPAYPDRPGSSAHRIAVGNLIPSSAAAEVAVGDDGTRGDGLVRVVDLRFRRIVLEFEAMPPEEARAGVQIWVADIVAEEPGDEMIVGQGDSGGRLRVFSLSKWKPEWLFDLPDPLARETSVWSHFAVGDLFPGLAGNEVAIAQSDSSRPIQVFSLDRSGATLIDEVSVQGGSAASIHEASTRGSISSIAVAQ